MLLLLSNIWFARSFQGWVFYQRSAGTPSLFHKEIRVSCRFSLKPTQWLFCSSLELGNWWECWKTWSTLRFSPPRRIQGWNANFFVLSKWFVLFGNQVCRYQQALRAYKSRLEREKENHPDMTSSSRYWLQSLRQHFQDCNLQLLLMNLQFDQFRLLAPKSEFLDAFGGKTQALDSNQSPFSMITCQFFWRLFSVLKSSIRSSLFLILIIHLLRYPILTTIFSRSKFLCWWIGPDVRRLQKPATAEKHFPPQMRGPGCCKLQLIGS